MVNKKIVRERKENAYMLLAGLGSVRIGKICDRGLENACGQHFQDLGHSFSLYGPTLSQPITFLSFFPVVNWLKVGLFTQLCH